MQKKLSLLSFSLVCYLVETSPLYPVPIDQLDTDIDHLKYQVEEEDLDDFGKLLDYGEDSSKYNEDALTTVSTSGFKKKNTSDRGQKKKHIVQDLKKFFNSVGVHDKGNYDDSDVYSSADVEASKAVDVKGKEDRSYRKGTKTRGFHRVHHKDEYKKDKVFYEDDEVKGTLNKVGVKGHGYKVGAGAEYNRGKHHHDHQKGIHGKRGYSDKGFTDNQFSGYSDSQGFDQSFSNES